MRTQWTTKGNRDAGPSCSCDRGLHRYLRNFGGVWTPQTSPLGTPLILLDIVGRGGPNNSVMYGQTLL